MSFRGSCLGSVKEIIEQKVIKSGYITIIKITSEDEYKDSVFEYNVQILSRQPVLDKLVVGSMIFLHGQLRSIGKAAYIFTSSENIRAIK